MSLETINSRWIKKELRKKSSTKYSVQLSKFFKTGKGQYGEGDIFLGVRVGDIRGIVKSVWRLPFTEIKELLKSAIHEERLAGVLILVMKFEASNNTARGRIYDFYLKNLCCVNNWDLVDLSAPRIVGTYLMDECRDDLFALAEDSLIWARRVSIVATHTFIRNNDFDMTLKLAERLLRDKEDLIHKAVGWMLREVGKRDVTVLYDFLDKYREVMPRMMLRYSIERFPEEKRRHYLCKEVRSNQGCLRLKK